MSVASRHRTSELLGLFLLFLSFLLALALISYDALDNSLNVASSQDSYSNFIGKFGAWSSDFLFQILGWSALCLPLPILVLGYKCLRSQAIEEPILKLIGISCFLLSLSAGLSILSPSVSIELNFAPGGIAGLILSQQLISYVNRTGALLISTATLILSLVASTTFSVDRLFDWLGNRNWNLFRTLWDRYSQWCQKRRNRKAVASWNKNKESVVSQPMPRKVVWDEVKTAEKAQNDKGTASQPIKLSVTSTLQESIEHEPKPVSSKSSYQLPSLDFLDEDLGELKIDETGLIARAHLLGTKCAEFGVLGQVLQIHPGPVVTTFEFKPDPGVKYSRITNLSDDLCLALEAESIRIERIPGKNTVGIEVPNPGRKAISLREILASGTFRGITSQLALGLGKKIDGTTYVADLAQMPHLLIAGATGSGKSVALNCIICSILYKATPDKVRFLMIDPKRLELGLYADIPHLMTPIVTDPKKASYALNWAVREMEIRYRKLAHAGVRSIDQYNNLVTEDPSQAEEDEKGPLPYIVIIVDELADLMLTTGKEVEIAVTRLAQMARAIGIHLILATQRPSVDVITGLIKANFPSRISFRVSSKIDSRTILDSNGAEQLLGMGDMLLLPPGTSRLLRVHGAWVSVKEINRITSFIKGQSNPDYRQEILEPPEEEKEAIAGTISPEQDALFEQAARFVVEAGKASTSLLQRRLRIGYGRAARLLDIMEHEGLIGPPVGTKPRDVLVGSDYFDLSHD